MRTRCIFLFVFISLLAFVACKNSGTGSQVDGKKIIIGKWKIAKITTEENYTEVAGAADDNNIVVKFNADGTGSSSSISGGSSFKWELTNDNTYLRIIDSAGSDPIALQLTKISGSSFTVKDTSTHPPQWEIFKKQNDK